MPDDDRSASTQRTPSPASAAADLSSAPAAAPLDDLAWMAGYWTADRDATLAEELWLTPRGGLMLGVHRDVTGDTRTFFEYLRIEQRDESCVYVASPRGGPATEFRLVEISGTRAVFENPGHDFPQRIVYWLEGETTLCARVENLQGESRRAMEWAWHRTSWG